MKISPKQFLKTRRPEQFSDSSIVSETSVDRLKLELYLDTLSSRNQELEFEGFVRSLCEVEICPNLLPHTGPTGGGDSKIDSETYPVSDITSLTWFTGMGDKAAKERWGFAFSIKKDWPPKVKSDIKKIHETGRGYKVAYFVSNQYVPDKKRAEVEDELKKLYDIDVRILDRNWILDKVFRNRREDIVKRELHIDVIEEVKTKKGPLDLQKEENLVVLDKKIERAVSSNQIDNSTVENAIKSAILARELEKPRVDIDGRFGRAERLANKYGSAYQQFEVAYQFAWTTFWWHEDFSTYIDLYQRVENKVINTGNVYNLERLTNLWYGLNNLYHQDKKLVDTNFFYTHTKILKDKLGKISKEKEEKPSASLYAKTLFLEIELVEKRFSGQGIGKTLIGLKEAVVESNNLIGFPFKPLVQILTEISEVLEDNPEYKDLFETILRVTEERDGELAVAKLLLDRGEKLIHKDRPYEAIRGLGSSLRKLYKYESRDEVVRALYLIGIAYEQVGLFWAARGALLSAASLATSDFWNYGDINTMQAACYKRLKWLELKLGRIPQALDWHNLDYAIRKILFKKGFNRERLFEQINNFDLALGILFLRTDLKTLQILEYLPDVLSELGLEYSSIALIYALSGENELPKEFTEAISSEEIKDFFNQWVNQYSSEILSRDIIFTEGTTVLYTSKILGCDVELNTENQEPCIEVSESILSAIESFLSTSILRHAVARESSVEINVSISSDMIKIIDYEVNDNEDHPIISIRCKKFNPHQVMRTEQDILRDGIFDIIVQISGRMVMFQDPQNDLEKIIRDERAPERAISFTSSFITLGNVLGHKPKIKISDWVDKKRKKYELKREKPLNFALAKKENIREQQSNPDDDPLSRAKHTDIQTISVIRDAFWDEAKWLGTGYLVIPDGKTPPVLSILFKNIEAGKKIFAAWKKRFGDKDQDEQIRVTIVRGIDRDNMYHYKIGIGANVKPPKKEEGDPRFIVSATQIHTMTPESLKNLDNFKQAHEAFGYYLLAPGSVGVDGLPDIIFDLGIIKREVNFREAWEIGYRDLDSVLINPQEDKPVIPTDIKNPPLEELLRNKGHRNSQQTTNS